MPSLWLQESAVGDLDAITSLCQQDGDDLWAFVHHMQESPDLIDRLCKWHYRHIEKDPQFDCKAITFLQEMGYNIYRLVALTLEWGRRNYRILYAYDSAYDDFYVLAVVRRLTDNTPEGLRASAYNYEPDHHITRRICDEYEFMELAIRH